MRLGIINIITDLQYITINIRQIQKHIVFLETGPCVINLTYELIPQLQCMLNILLHDDKKELAEYSFSNDEYERKIEIIFNDITLMFPRYY